MRLSALIIAFAGCLLSSCDLPDVAPQATPVRGGQLTTPPKTASTGVAAASRTLPSSSQAPVAMETPAVFEALPCLATIESVSAELDPDHPAQAIVTISGLLHDGATHVQSIEQQRSAQSVAITLATTRPAHVGVAVALVPFERKVIVDLHGLRSGPCRVTANGASTLLMVP